MKKILLTLPCLLFLINSHTQTFDEVAEINNISYTYGQGIFGGGLSFCDFNGDGWDDLTLTSEQGQPLRFFQNTGGSFMELPLLVFDTTETKQVLWVDYDNDGDKDLFVTSYDAPNRLYQNDGTLEMIDVTTAVGLPVDSESTFGAMFGDINKDGWLDLYVMNRVIGMQVNRMFVSDGDGTFTDFTADSIATNHSRLSFCGIFWDYNRDGWQDIYVANDKFTKNTLFKNLGVVENAIVFQDVSDISNAGIRLEAMNTSGIDYDGDGDLDMYVTNTQAGNVFLENQGDGTFIDLTQNTHTALNRFCWGANFFDYDNDRDLDLYVSTSIPQKESPNALMTNINGIFVEPYAAIGGIGYKDTVSSYGNAIGDFNNDGLLDIAVQNQVFDMMLWQNTTTNVSVGNWLKIELEGTIGNRDGIGSWIEVYSNGQRQTLYTYCGEAYLAQNSTYHHFGLSEFEQADSVIVRWLSGVVDKQYNVEAGQTIKIIEDSTTSVSLEKIAHTTRLDVKIFPNPTNEMLFINTNSEKSLDCLLKLTSISGILKQQYPLTLSGKYSQKILPFVQLPNGVYFLSLYHENQLITTKKIVKY